MFGQQGAEVENVFAISKVGNRRKAIGKAIAKEDYLWTEGTDSTEGKNTRKITGTGVDNYASGVVKISPQDGTEVQSGPKSVYAHTEVDGELIVEKAKSKAQQRFMGMVYAVKKGKKAMSPEVAAAAEGMTKKEAKKYAKTKHKGLPEKVEEAMCSPEDEKKKDTRGDYAKINLIKNKLRAMGAKNPIVMVANENVMKGALLPGEGRPTYPKGEGPKKHGKDEPKLPLQNAGFEPTGNVISEREFDEPGEEDWRPEVRSHNKMYGGYNRPVKKKPNSDPKPGSGPVKGA